MHAALRPCVGVVGPSAPCPTTRTSRQHQAGAAPVPSRRRHARSGASTTTTTVACAALPSSSSWDSFKRLMFLPGGGVFMTDADAGAPVYGDSFVMHGAGSVSSGAFGRRGRRGASTGLVRLRQRPATAVQRQQQQARDIIPLRLDEVEVSIVVLPASSSTSGSSLTRIAPPFRRLLAGPAASDAADSDGDDDSSSSSSASLAIVPRDGSMFGMVMSSAVRRRGDDVPLPSSDSGVYETPFNDKNPRRTMKIKFVCKRCGATTIKPINPHAWASGSVFAKCGCCQVTHKLIDNLKLFHELSGPMFGPGTQAPPAPKTSRLGMRLDSEPPLPPPLRLRFPESFPDDTAGLN